MIQEFTTSRIQEFFVGSSRNIQLETSFNGSPDKIQVVSREYMQSPPLKSNPRKTG